MQGLQLSSDLPTCKKLGAAPLRSPKDWASLPAALSPSRLHLFCCAHAYTPISLAIPSCCDMRLSFCFAKALTTQTASAHWLPRAELAIGRQGVQLSSGLP